MKRFFPFAALAGFALGAWCGHAPSMVEKAAARTARVGPASSGRLHGMSDPGETALGDALNELRNCSDDLRAFARLGDALARLDAAQLPALFDRLESIDTPWDGNGASWLMAWWVRRDPAAASAWLGPRLERLAQDGPLGKSFGRSTRGELVLAWAKADPHAAFEAARRHPRSGLAARLFKTVVGALPEAEMRVVLEEVRAFPASRTRALTLRAAHGRWAESDPAAAFASAQALEPGRARDLALGETLAQWAQRDPPAALANYGALGFSDPVLLAKMLEGSASRQPRQTLEWLTRLAPSEQARAAASIVEGWAKNDPAAALGWAFDHGVRLTRRSEIFFQYEQDGFGAESSMERFEIAPLNRAFEANADATMAWLRSLPPGEERDRMVEISIGPCGDRERALTLFRSLPPDAAARQAGEMARKFGGLENARPWAESLPPGPIRAAAWRELGENFSELRKLPPGPDLDAVLGAFAFKLDLLNGETAEHLQTLLKISDPVARRDAIDEMMEFDVEIPTLADEARAALERASVPDEWKQRWREVR